MKKKVALATVLAALAVALTIPAFSSAHTVLTAHATGGQIVNPGGGDPKGAATFVLKVNRVKSRICFNIKFSKIKDATSAHLHKGRAGQIARPIVTFFDRGVANSPQKGCVSAPSRVVSRLKRKPAQHYVDIDSRSRPNGAVLGQLSRN